MSVEALHVRIEDHGRRLAELERTQPAITARDVVQLNKDFGELKDELIAIKRALYGTILSVVGATVVWAFTAFRIWGG